MTEPRIVVETECADESCIGRSNPRGECYGHRRVLSEGEYVLIEKVDGEWPEWARLALMDPPLYELSPAAQMSLGSDGEAVKVNPKYVLDALAQERT